MLLILKLCRVRHNREAPAVEQISLQEYETQAKEYTQQQCAALRGSPEYKEAAREKGEENEQEWNW